jgi:hypothetical protein
MRMPSPANRGPFVSCTSAEILAGWTTADWISGRVEKSGTRYGMVRTWPRVRVRVRVRVRIRDLGTSG